MGAYLSTPLTEKESTDEINKYLSCGASQMQGWRMSQEDAHICSLEFDNATSLFAVFDGHGGSEVALYCSKKLPEFLKNTAAYKSGDYEQALKDAFIGFDATLVSEEVIEVLKELMPVDKAEDGTETEEDGEAEDDEEDLAELCQEGRMPLDKLLERYKDGKNLAIAQLKKGEASGSKPASPALRGRRNLSNGQNSAGCSQSSQNDDAEKDETTVVTERKIEISVKEEEEETVSSSSTSAGACSKSEQTNEATCSNVSASGSSSSSSEQTSTSSTEKTEATVNPTKNEGSSNHGPSSSSSGVGSGSGSGSGSSSEIKSVPEKNYCNSPDSSSTAKKNSEKVKEAPGSSSNVGSSPDATAHVNGSETKTTTSKHIHIEAEVSEVSTISCKGDSVSSSSIAVVTIENGVGSSNADADKSQNKISSTNNRKSRSMPDVSNDSSSDEDEEDGSYNEERSSGDEDGEEVDMDDSEEAEEGDEEEDTEDEEAMFPTDFDEDEKFLNNMFEGPGSSSGCTAVMALLHQNQLYVANAGDSRCVVCRDGKALEMSLDHKPEDKEELLRIRKAGGRVTLDGRVNGGLNLSRAIGDHAYKTNKGLKPEEQMISALPDIRKITISPEDEFMILACDGIWNSLTSEEVVEFIRSRILKGQTKISAICEELFTECLAPNTCGDGTGCDNMTAVIVQFKPLLMEEYSKNESKAATDVTTSTESPAIAKKRPASPTADDVDGLSKNDSNKRLKTEQNDVNNVVEPTNT